MNYAYVVALEIPINKLSILKKQPIQAEVLKVSVLSVIGICIISQITLFVHLNCPKHILGRL